MDPGFRRGDEGLLIDVEPHGRWQEPPLPTLRATFSHKGRRKSTPLPSRGEVRVNEAQISINK